MRYIVKRRSIGRIVALVCALTIATGPVLAAAAMPSQAKVPVGTRVTLALKGWLSSKDANVGDTFEATLTEDISSEGQVVIPAGAIFVGRVAGVERASGLSKSGKLTLVIDKLVSGDGRSAAAPGSVTGLEEGGEIKGENKSAKKAAIGGGIGGILGAIVGGTTGLLVGLAVGAGGAIAAGKGENVTLPEGTRLLVKFDQEVDVTWGWRPQS